MRIHYLSLLFSILSNPCFTQWAASDVFPNSWYFAASAFHHQDTGIFVVGGHTPNSSGGIYITLNGLEGSGTFESIPTTGPFADIDVLVVDGYPYYMAVGHQSGFKDDIVTTVLRPIMGPDAPYQFVSVNTALNSYYRTIRWRPDLVAFAAGGNVSGDGLIHMSEDLGESWIVMAILPGHPVSRLHFVNEQLGFASTGGYVRTGWNAQMLPDSGGVFRTLDGGFSWQQVLADSVTGFSSVVFRDEFTGLAARNDGVIMRTLDGGNTWNPVTLPLTGVLVLSTITYRPDGACFAGAFRPDGSYAYILMSADDGATWTVNYSTADHDGFRRVLGLTFYDDAHGYAANHAGMLYTTGLISTQVPEHDDSNEVRIYPNPATDQVIVDLVNMARSEVGVVDALGRRCLQQFVTSQRLELSVLDLKEGLYTVYVRNADGVRHVKMVVQR